jgi:exodeoxyribonuclease-5
MNSFQFSQDQLDAVNGICNQLLDPNTKSHVLTVLTGSAGTGKTTVVGEIINKINQQSPLTSIALCATTHRAATVLQDITGKPVITGHALFKLRPTVNKHGKETIATAGVCNVPHGSVVIIDESSMIGNKFLESIVDIVTNRTLKLIFVGDSFQLPPPTDMCSIFDGSLSTFTLTQVHRQLGGNPVLEKANEFREYIEGIRDIEPTLETNINSKGEGIHILPHADFVTKFVKKYISYSAGAPVDIPLCTYTNASAINYNNMVRKSAFFLEDVIEPFYKGERLISNSVVMHSDKSILTNNETVHVQDYIEGIQHGIPGYYVTVHGELNMYTGTIRKKVFSPKSKGIADKVLEEHKKDAIKSKSKQGWLNFYSIKNSLADLRPPFAGTTHKAQGGTFPAVFIDKININKCRDEATRARLFYVALTRASKNVYINS